jgi:hypothetical protein
MPSGSFQVSTNGTGFVVLPAGGYWSTTDDAANNRSLVYVQFSVAKNSASSATFGNGTWGININGTNYPVSKNITIPGNTASSPVLVHSASVYIGHNTDGSRANISASVSGGIPGTSWTTTTGSTSSISFTDYNRSPTWIDADASGSVLRGDFFSNSVSANAASGYDLAEGGFPPGIGLSGGTVSGTPTTVGSWSFRLRANGSFEGSVETGWQTITVNPRPPVFSDGSVNSSARVGIAYSDGVSASETSSYSVVAAPNNLPPGLSLNTSNGAITGTPTTPGSYSFRIRASNSTGSTDTAIQTITVISAARVWNGSAFVSGLANVWNGSAFVTGTIRVWDGSTWRNTN